MEISDQIIENKDFTVSPVEEAYVNCKFKQCRFAGLTQRDTTWENCTFDTCDFSLSKLKHTAFYDVFFKDCKLMGTDFSSCNPFSSFRFGQCQMRYVNFRGMKMIKTSFIMCDMMGADFANANLQGSLFEQCDLSGAMFHNTNLTAVDFSSAYNMAIVPENNKLKNAVFSRLNLEGLVIHLGIKFKD